MPDKTTDEVKKLKYLVFDATPVNKVKNPKALPSDTTSWPRLIHISWILLNDELKPITDRDYIITPDGFAMSGAIKDFAKIDDEDIEKKSKNLKEALDEFSIALDDADYVFAHNLAMNAGVVGAEFIRNTMKNRLAYANSYCLMHESTFFCKLPSKTGGYKWPTLNELHARIFNKQYSPGNNARADVIAATRSFIALKKYNKLADIFEDDLEDDED